MLNFAIKKPYNRTLVVHICKAFHFLSYNIMSFKTLTSLFIEYFYTKARKPGKRDNLALLCPYQTHSSTQGGKSRP